MDTVRSFVKDSLTKVTQKILMKDVTWSELVSLRDNNQLIKGTQYRITDYACTTTQADTQSANHPFDIIVTADSENTINENARAIQHSGDTYFANSDLAAWELKYSLDNDTTKFAWADSGSTGRGVIYYMKDEWNNECHYDFKNICYNLYCCFYVSWRAEQNPYIFYRDSSLDENGYYGWRSDRSMGGMTILYTNTPKATLISTDYIYSNTSGEYYPLGAMGGTIVKRCDLDMHGYTFNCIQSNSNADGSLLGNCNNNIILPRRYSSNRFQLSFNQFTSTSSSLDSRFNHIGYDCHDNIFFNGSCNTLGIGCYQNKFGGDGYGNSAYCNIFGSWCYNNILERCEYNIFGNQCSDNELTAGNSYGPTCARNIFGNRCSYNTLNKCSSNIFGNDCIYNTFEDYCSYNTFGNNCSYISIQKDYVQNIIVENGNQYIDITSTRATSSTAILRNLKIAQGVNNTTTRKTISHNTINDIFQTIYQPANSQTVTI